MIEPKVLLFDEPLSNLDAKLRVYMRDELRALQKRLNITSLYVTHDQSEAMAISDRVVIMNKGRIAQVGTPREIYDYPVSRFVADFIGRANFLEGTFLGTEGKAAVVLLAGSEVRLPDPGTCLPEKNAPCDLVVRPEAMEVNQDEGFPGTVTSATFYGTRMEYTVRLEDGKELFIESYVPQLHRQYTEGESVRVRLNEACVRVLPCGKQEEE